MDNSGWISWPDRHSFNPWISRSKSNSRRHDIRLCYFCICCTLCENRKNFLPVCRKSVYLGNFPGSLCVYPRSLSYNDESRRARNLQVSLKNFFFNSYASGWSLWKNELVSKNGLYRDRLSAWELNTVMVAGERRKSDSRERQVFSSSLSLHICRLFCPTKFMKWGWLKGNFDIDCTFQWLCAYRCSDNTIYRSSFDS